MQKRECAVLCTQEIIVAGVIVSDSLCLAPTPPLPPIREHQQISASLIYYIFACLGLFFKVQVWALHFSNFYLCISVLHEVLDMPSLNNPRLHLYCISSVYHHVVHIFFIIIILLSVFYLILCLAIFSLQSLTSMNLHKIVVKFCNPPTRKSIRCELLFSLRQSWETGPNVTFHFKWRRRHKAFCIWEFLTMNK